MLSPRQESNSRPLDRPVSAVGQERLRSGGCRLERTEKTELPSRPAEQIPWYVCRFPQSLQANQTSPPNFRLLPDITFLSHPTIRVSNFAINWDRYDRHEYRNPFCSSGLWHNLNSRDKSIKTWNLLSVQCSLLLGAKPYLMTAVHQARQKPALRNEGQSLGKLKGVCTRPRERQKLEKPTCQPYAFIPVRRNKSRKVGIPSIEVHKLPSLYCISRWITETSFNRQHYDISQQYPDPNIHWRQGPKSHLQCKLTETKRNLHFSTQSALSHTFHHKHARENPQEKTRLFR
jgi:hypothetical protein